MNPKWKKMKTFECLVVEDSAGELCIELSDELCESLNIKVGDDVEWKHVSDKVWELIKV